MINRKPRKNIPAVNNESSTIDLFYGNVLHDLTQYEDFEIAPIDQIGKKFLYGRVDYKGNTVIPAPDSLAPIRTDSDSELLLVQPVAQAASEFLDFYQKSGAKGVLDGSSLLFSIKAKRAYIDPYSRYIRIQNGLLANFVSLPLKHKNFKQFMRNYIDFVENGNFISLFSIFLTSRFADPVSTGLMFDIKDYKHDDGPRRQAILNDKNFTFYYKAALKYGFKIDKLSPWRLIADIESPGMKKYLELSKIVDENIFEKYYKNAYEDDINLLKTLLYNAYYSYAAKASSCLSDNPTVTDLNSLYGDEYWLIWYAELMSTQA